MWRHLVAKFPTIACGATWCPTFQLKHVVPPGEFPTNAKIVKEVIKVKIIIIIKEVIIVTEVKIVEELKTVNEVKMVKEVNKSKK